MTTSVDEIVAQLATVATLGTGAPHWRARLLGSALAVRFELVDAAGAVHPFVMRVDAERSVVAPAADAVANEDVVVRTDPVTLRRVLDGDLSGRDAIVGGLLDIRKSPAMPKLLLLRSLFARYQKAVRRGELAGAHGG